MHDYSLSKNNNRNRIKNLILENPYGINTYGKPYQIGEIGALQYLPLTDLDFHNSLWASSMMGGVTAGLSWGTNTAYNGFQQNYIGLKNFFADIDFEQNYYTVNVSNYDFLSKDAGIGNKDNKFEYFAMSNYDETKAFGWVHNRSNYISAAYHNAIYDTIKTISVPHADSVYLHVTCPEDDDEYGQNVDDNDGKIDDDITLNCINGIQSRDADDQKIKLNGFNGRYRVEWYNTTTGNYISSQYENSIWDGSLWSLKIKIPFAIGPNLVNDYAFKAFYDPQFGGRLANVENDNEIKVNYETINSNTTFNVNLYPNPTNKDLNIISNKMISKIEIYSALSKLVFDESYSDATKNINLKIEKFSSGTYFVKVWTTENECKNFKFIKL